MTWDERSPYSHHDDVMGRVHLHPMERLRLRRERRERRGRNICICIVAASVVSWVVIAVVST